MGFACVYAVRIYAYGNLIPGLVLFKWIRNKSKGKALRSWIQCWVTELRAIQTALTALLLSILAVRLPGFPLRQSCYHLKNPQNAERHLSIRTWCLMLGAAKHLSHLPSPTAHTQGLRCMWKLARNIHGKPQVSPPIGWNKPRWTPPHMSPKWDRILTIEQNL